MVELLGEGGSGETWLCIDLVTKEKVAIKALKRPIPKIVLPMVLHEIKVCAVHNWTIVEPGGPCALALACCRGSRRARVIAQGIFNY